MRPHSSLIMVAVLAGVVTWSTTLATDAAEASRSAITNVVELFTSEGCSSCPPADALLKSYIARDGVLALSFNVDIWDNLGWKDTLANPAFTQRQRAYARTRGDGQVYTPQAIINGAAHAVGSDRVEIDQALHDTSIQSGALRVAVAVTAEGDGLDITTPAMANSGSAKPVDATLWLVKFTPAVSVKIERGENSGHTVTYHNVVRTLTAVGHWSGQAGSTKVNRAAIEGCAPGTCAILLQQGGTSTILGAAWVPGTSGI